VRRQKPQVGPRLDEHTYTTVKQLAEREGMSISKFTERIIVGYLEKRQQGGGTIDIDDALRQSEARIAAMLEKASRAMGRQFQDLMKEMERVLGVRPAAADEKPELIKRGPNGEVFDGNTWVRPKPN
jgi:hypothetical protein